MAYPDAVTVGGNLRNIGVIGDPVTAAAMVNMVQAQLTDAQNLDASLYAMLVGQVALLLNSSGTFDRARSALGTTGIPSINSEGTLPTYNAGVVAFTPIATPTDIWKIAFVTNVVRVTRISISGMATAAATVDIQLIRRSTANTGGTTTTITASKNDANDGAPSATVMYYSAGANPTTGTSAGIVRAEKLNLGAAGAAGKIVWDFSTRNSKGILLRTAAQELVINWGGAAVPAGTVLDIDVEWTEAAA